MDKKGGGTTSEGREDRRGKIHPHRDVPERQKRGQVREHHIERETRRMRHA
jgi:hypothetical protein